MSAHEKYQTSEDAWSSSQAATTADAPQVSLVVKETNVQHFVPELATAPRHHLSILAKSTVALSEAQLVAAITPLSNFAVANNYFRQMAYWDTLDEQQQWDMPHEQAAWANAVSTYVSRYGHRSEGVVLTFEPSVLYQLGSTANTVYRAVRAVRAPRSSLQATRQTQSQWLTTRDEVQWALTASRNVDSGVTSCPSLSYEVLSEPGQTPGMPGVWLYGCHLMCGEEPSHE